MDENNSTVNEAVENVSYKHDALSEDKYYTVEEWLTWDESIRSELHDGKLIMLSQPVARHQKVLGELFGQLWLFLKGKPCDVYVAPFGVRLFENEDTAFEPDIVVICDKSKLDRIYTGAPDLVIEILSPSTARMDKLHKFRKYQKAGVKEYWIVDAEDNYIQASVLKDGSYITTMHGAEDIAPVTVLDGCEINLADVFEDE